MTNSARRFNAHALEAVMNCGVRVCDYGHAMSLAVPQ